MRLLHLWERKFRKRQLLYLHIQTEINAFYTFEKEMQSSLLFDMMF